MTDRELWVVVFNKAFECGFKHVSENRGKLMIGNPSRECNPFEYAKDVADEAILYGPKGE